MIVAYNVTNTILVDVRKLNQVGSVIDAALSHGANMIASLQFYASNTEIARRTAIATAIEKARADAEAGARAAHGSLGSLLEINIGAYSPPPPRPMMMARVAGGVALWICIDEESALFCGGETRCQVYRRCSFTDTALLICNRYYSRHEMS